MTIRFVAVVAELRAGSNGHDGVRISLRCPVVYMPSGDLMVIEASGGEASAYRIGTVVDVALTPK